MEHVQELDPTSAASHQGDEQRHGANGPIHTSNLVERVEGVEEKAAGAEHLQQARCMLGTQGGEPESQTSGSSAPP